MDPLRYCTLTGVDESTDLDRLHTLTRRYPFVEWGVLHSAQRVQEEGGKGRFPRVEWIKAFLERARMEGWRTAVHLCGRTALDFVARDKSVWEFIQPFNRVQLNLVGSGMDGLDLRNGMRAKDLREAIQVAIRDHDQHFIVQHNKKNERIFESFQGVRGLAWLFDSSGGNGISPGQWPRIEGRSCRFGYAGGLGPGNIAQELPLISEAAQRRPYWIDMEGKLRVDDRLDLDRCEAVLKEVAKYLLNRSERAGAYWETAFGMSQGGAGTMARRVADLDRFWLDWWVGAAAGYRMVIPPPNPAQPVFFDRIHGEFTAFNPSSSDSSFQRVMDQSDAVAVNREGVWLGLTAEGLEIPAKSRNDALLRATIVQRFGLEVPVNPARQLLVLHPWIGAENLGLV